MTVRILVGLFTICSIYLPIFLDQCEPPPNFQELSDTSGRGLNYNGSVCLNNVCMYAWNYFQSHVRPLTFCVLQVGKRDFE